MRFILRDDDLNYFSTPADIEQWYAGIFAQKIPVGFAAIPFVKPISDVYTNNAPKEDKEYPISGNSELTEYVKHNSCIEILQHGCTHETKDGIFEYQQQRNLIEDTRRGKEELGRAFGAPVTIFAPPHDWIGTSGILGIEAAHMNVIRGRGAGLRNIILRPRYILNFFKMLVYKLVHSRSDQVPAYPYVLNFGWHKEACSYRLEDTDIFDGLEYAHAKNGIFVVVTHLHFYTAEKKERLLQLISRAQELGAEFARPSALYEF